MKGIVFLLFAVLLTLCAGGCCRPEDIGTTNRAATRAGNACLVLGCQR